MIESGVYTVIHSTVETVLYTLYYTHCTIDCTVIHCTIYIVLYTVDCIKCKERQLRMLINSPLRRLIINESYKWVINEWIWYWTLIMINNYYY